MSLQIKGLVPRFLRCRAKVAIQMLLPVCFFSLSASAGTVLLTQFGPAGQGSNDTTVFQSAINSAAANSETLEIPASAQPYNVSPLNIPSNTTLVLDPGVIVRAAPGYGPNDSLLVIDGVNNVSITGTPGQSVFQMLKSQYSSGEYRHCMYIYGSQNVQVQGIQCNQAGGDGVYIGGLSRNVTVANSGFDQNARNGMSITSASGVLVDHCTFSNTAGNRNLASGGPWDGIDMEPNGPSDQLSNIVVQNTAISGNAGNGLVVTLNNLNSGSNAVSVVINNVTSSGNGGDGFAAWNSHDAGVLGPNGSVLFENSTSTNDANYGAAAIFYDAGSAQVTFNNITIVNPNSSGTNVDGAAFAIKRGGGGRNPMGNVTVNGLSVVDNVGTIQSYFTVEDYSHIGVSNIHIQNFGQLLGASANNALGVLNGQLVNILSIN